MGKTMWTEDEVLRISKDRETVLKNIVKTLSTRNDIVFAAKLGFGVPIIDLVTVDRLFGTSGYIIGFPVIDGKINTLPYFQGLGKSLFITDQMFDNSYFLVPDIELSDNTPFTRSPDPLYRLKNATFDSGICVFDTDYNVKTRFEAKGSLTKQYWRLKVELLDSILKHGEIMVGEGKEGFFNEWKRGVEEDLSKLGDKKLLDKESATSMVKKILEDKNYYNISMNFEEGEIESSPRPIPIFNVGGSGLYLGDEKEFSLVLSRISGVPIRSDF